ncbi:uncharacterized protein B0I36DRAFT_432302 [Microdochium trichocladiopsis]|uniref:Uncharacterized protein n=1 Tax=Microdochium trichocladiopsis TaxID=1682393 RepID=A0A9P8Y4R6_9PEZI|nr:uncharacterized protein B0I36DRAFT_432302 [Microdochium trichocladiopsis]KAH7029552.1 hypothetical protein B0I36DRAFT_432302 [Microdochium trichocladiopsis]
MAFPGCHHKGAGRVRAPSALSGWLARGTHSCLADLAEQPSRADCQPRPCWRILCAVTDRRPARSTAPDSLPRGNRCEPLQIADPNVRQSATSTLPLCSCALILDSNETLPCKWADIGGCRHCVGHARTCLTCRGGKDMMLRTEFAAEWSLHGQLSRRGWPGR